MVLEQKKSREYRNKAFISAFCAIGCAVGCSVFATFFIPVSFIALATTLLLVDKASDASDKELISEIINKAQQSSNNTCQNMEVEPQKQVETLSTKYTDKVKQERNLQKTSAYLR